MKNKTQIICLLHLIGCIWSFLACSAVPNERENLSEHWEVAAAKKWNGKDSVVVCDLSLLKDTVDIPLSFFVEDFQILKLDNREEALVGITNLVVSENYILVCGSVFDGYPCRLFTKEGRFVTNIGAIGQGPGEYRAVYGAQIDEKNGCLYLIPFANSKSLYVYNLQGKPLRSLPLHRSVAKAAFRVDTEKRQISFGVLPFNGYPLVAWTQDFEGHLLDSVPSQSYLSVVPDYSNEAYYGGNTADFDLHIFTFWEHRPDTLYHYISTEGRLKPCFTLNYQDRKRSINNYFELPGCYLGKMSVEKQVAATQWETQSPSVYIVDKETLRGTFFHLKNDYLGGMPEGDVPWRFQNGYYARLVEPGQLQDEIEKHLASGAVTDEKIRGTLQDFYQSIREGDNSYVFYAKQKGVKK